MKAIFFQSLGKTHRQVPPIRRSARYNPFGRRDLLEWGFKEIVDQFEKTIVNKQDYEDFLQTGTAIDIDVDDELIDSFEEARRAFRLREKAIPLALDEPGWHAIRSQMDMSSTSGYPHFKKQGEIIDLLYEDAHQLGHFMKYKRPEDVIYPPCYLAMKPAEYNKFDKIRKYREIYEYPSAIKINEMRYTSPLYKSYKLQQFEDRPVLFGEDVKEMVRTYFLNFVQPDKFGNKYAVKLDFSKFNRRVSRPLIIMAFDIIKDNIEFGGYPYSKSHAKRNYNQFLCLRHYFINTPFVLPDRRIYSKRSGVPSGSGFTLLVNSIVSRIVVNACLLKLGLPMITTLKTCGDDVSFGLPEPIDMDKLSIAASTYQMEIHPDKCSCEEIAPMQLTSEFPRFKLLGYVGFPYRITFDQTTLWKNTYLCSTYVLTKNDHLARVYSLFKLTGGNNYMRFCEYYNYCLVTYSGKIDNVEIVMKPSNVFQHTGQQLRYGKVIARNAFNEWWADYSKRVDRCCDTSRLQPDSMVKYYYAIAEKAARKYYFKNRHSIEKWQLDQVISAIFEGALQDAGFYEISQQLRNR